MKTNIFSDTEKKSRSIEVYVDQNDFSWKEKQQNKEEKQPSKQIHRFV